MNFKRWKWPLMVVATLLLAGCQSGPEADQTEDAAEASEPREEETVDQSDEKVNDRDGLGGEVDRAEEGDEGGEGCPAPEPSEEMCAQVIVWALTADGKCCEYPTPCHVPEGMETFHNQQECEAAAESSEGEATE